MQHTFDAKIWLVAGEAGWHFVTVPENISDHIRALTQGLRNAFGSLRVVALVGKTQWTTSLFVDRKRKAFLLPLKADVRRREKLRVGKAVRITISLQV